MRLLVCGGRDYADWNALHARLDALLKERGRASVLIHGGARGADTIAGEWAEGNGIPVLVFHAEWEKYGKAAGSIRNKRMLVEGQPDLVIGFPGGPGTANMVFQARQERVPVILVLGNAVREDDRYLF